ncbi:MAG TPA: type I methionyl aminopeptidase [Planctomycetes bacterium]|nr:type I methionyl aminopeptidase [Planctomycetota bacterium]
MVTLRSRREIELMRGAGSIVVEAFAEAARVLKPGVSTYEINRTIEKVIEKRRGEPLFKGYRGFPAASCVSINEEVVHGIPHRGRRVAEGDLVSLDVGVRRQGYCGDAAVTFPVGAVDARARALCAACIEALDAAVADARPGARLSQVSNAVESYARARGYSVVKRFVGHGIGTELHEAPHVPNYVDEEVLRSDMLLRPGMVLAIEPMLNEGTEEVVELGDKWTVVTADRKLSAHFEHTVAVGPDGPEILTPWHETIDTGIFSGKIGLFINRERLTSHAERRADSG